MEFTAFEPFFNPSSVLIIGASRNEYTFNGVVLKNLLEVQYKGKIYIVHPFTSSLLGIPCYASLQEIETLEKKPELAIILTHHEIIENLTWLGKHDISHILIETDISIALSKENQILLETQLKTIIQQYHLKVLGPSMIGIIDFHHHFSSSVIPTRAHRLSLIPSTEPLVQTPGASYLAQSGGLSGALGWWTPQQPIPFAKVIHIGNEMQISEAEVLEFLFQDPLTGIILLYIRTISPEFIRVMTKYRGTKPLLYKYVGKEIELDAQFQAAGAITVENYIELFEFAKLFLWCPPPENNYVGIIGPSSGAINLLISEMRSQQIHLASLDPLNRASIMQKIGGSTCNLGNPVDYWPPKEFVGTQVCQIYYNASNILLQDTHVGTLLLALEFFAEIEFNFSIFERIQHKYPLKPIIVVLIHAEKEGEERILKSCTELHIPVFINEAERSIRGLKCLLQYWKKNELVNQ